MTTPTMRRVDQYTGTVARYPSYCAVCDTDTVWFPTLKARRRFEDTHQHGGTD